MTEQTGEQLDVYDLNNIHSVVETYQQTFHLEKLKAMFVECNRARGVHHSCKWSRECMSVFKLDPWFIRYCNKSLNMSQIDQIIEENTELL